MSCCFFFFFFLVLVQNRKWKCCNLRNILNRFIHCSATLFLFLLEIYRIMYKHLELWRGKKRLGTSDKFTHDENNNERAKTVKWPNSQNNFKNERKTHKPSFMAQKNLFSNTTLFYSSNSELGARVRSRPFHVCLCVCLQMVFLRAHSHTRTPISRPIK